MSNILRFAGWAQLCGGAAFLESHGYVHGDLRPDNLLIDKNGNLRIHDLGSSLPVGNQLPVAAEPFGRLLSREGRKGRRYGLAGPYTENFAIGSIFYNLTRGHYPHAREGYDVPTLMKMFQRKEFPQINRFDGGRDHLSVLARGSTGLLPS